MSHNWGFVIAGYAITTVTLTGYFAWMRAKARHLRRTLGDERRD